MMLSTIINMMRKPTANVLAARELDDARRDLLQAQRHRDYYQKLAEFHALRIDRLRNQLRDENDHDND
jgi:hypothetical protein